ncbi:hypothetical protein P691DRAFT_716920 [Macrolepiota fuliginosa MF-IS2]|uniref:Protein kinase domain-containing protein n=1 Tax=Macrolepiota fuliginosa MF-IS2 TaxID=1400762 RepID=A0A9P5XN41_9AGAR|nr:hypothetical protein P691DRAFT_716920 [Macrolepiota fuliginosa MF-IS2]
MENDWESDYDSDSFSTSSAESVDDEEVNQRVYPYWPRYRALIFSRGLRLDTVRDVKEIYKERQKPVEDIPAGIDMDMGEEALCPDPGLPENLFRGTRVNDGKKIIVKAVHIYSHEYDIIRALSRGPARGDPRNHTIPVLDLIDFPPDNIGLIVMEEWSPQLITDDGPCCLSLFFAALRQCIEHVVFMHSLRMTHLDISLQNIVTDYNGRYAYIDFELARRFDDDPNPRITWKRGAEPSPECERGESSDPYKVDVWALGILIVKACELTGYGLVPQLMHVVSPMLNHRPEERPSSRAVLRAFDRVVPLIDEEQSKTVCRGDRSH